MELFILFGSGILLVCVPYFVIRNFINCFESKSVKTGAPRPK